ncbi:MAG: glycosyltransferase family 4 protein [Anaerolineae bacterium]|nr:glycosyltransferase family 4 protein [Anaerolineae bacterium]MDW8171501.1 glycosyltransferase family 4 protein [Anaerolineae bacterium]
MESHSRPLNILISLLYYFPHRTGLTIHVQSIAEELARRGHHVTVLTARYRKDLPRDEEVHNGVRVIRLWAPIRISRGMLMPAFPWAAYLLMRQADIVSIHTPMLETALVALLAKLADVNVVATHHGDLILPDKPFNRFIQGTMFLLYRYMANNAAQLIGYSQDYAENSYYLKPYLHKTTVNYPPVFMPRPRPERVAELRRQWQVDGGPIIGYAGRFVEEKRPDLAICALDVVNAAYPGKNARLVFAGEYNIPYESTWAKHQGLVAQYRDQLIFLGLLTDPQDMADFYAACDVVVLPSDTECFALAQVEAMLCGTPMVMTDIPGGRVPVQATGMGKLARRGDYQSIGQAIVEVLHNRAAYIKPREEIERVFSFKETVDCYEAIFRRFARPAR